MRLGVAGVKNGSGLTVEHHHRSGILATDEDLGAVVAYHYADGTVPHRNGRNNP
jgi:hypothetical protein